MSLITTAGKAAMLTAATAWGAATIKVVLVGDGYTPDSTATNLTTAATYEVTGAGYTGGYGGSGRKTLASKTVTADQSDEVARLDAADLTWTALDAGLVRYALLVIETGGSDATSVLLACLDVPATLTDGADFTLTWPESGLLVL